MSNKKILFITVRSDRGGGPKHLFDLVEGLKKKGILPYIASPCNPPFAEQYKKTACAHIVIPHRRISFLSFLKILFLLKKEKIRIIHSHGRGAGLYSRPLYLFGFKIIHTFHGAHTESSMESRIKNFFDRIFKYLTDVFICVSKDEKTKALAFSYAKDSQIQVINNGIDKTIIQSTVENISMNTARDILNMENPERPLVGYLARLDHVKGIDTLISFASRWKKETGKLPFKFLVGGDGKERKNLEILIKNFNLREEVLLLGDVKKPLIFLKCLDIYVSFSHQEGLPLSVLEAMSIPLPCLLSHIEGHRCLAVDDGVVLFSTRDFDDFRKKMEILLHDPLYRKELQRKALMTIEKHHRFDHQVERTWKIYDGF